jgi:soluble lytic murein transglycosylase-like protein
VNSSLRFNTSWIRHALHVGAVVVAVIVFAAAIEAARRPGEPLFPQSAPIKRPPDTRVLELPSVRRLFDALAGERASPTEGERVASGVDLSLLVHAVLGDPVSPLAFDEPVGAAPGRQAPQVLVTREIAARDTAAYQLLSLGYSARETADVVSGRISKQALDTAQKMLMVGQGREAAADYLDSQYRAVALRHLPGTAAEMASGAVPNRFEGAVERYARLHGVGAALVRAIIGVESAFDPGARSPAGAIGLMQLMPATARALGVDPSQPEQNIEGGVRYFSELLRMFDGIELALVAYNGGPGYARRYARGEAALYGETRDYVRRVLALARAPR